MIQSFWEVIWAPNKLYKAQSLEGAQVIHIKTAAPTLSSIFAHLPVLRRQMDRMYLIFIVISFSLLYPTLCFPHYDIRTRRAVFDIIPKTSSEGLTGADCQCGNSDPVCVLNKIGKCENKNNLERIKESKDGRSKLRTLFKKWILNKGKKDKIWLMTQDQIWNEQDRQENAYVDKELHKRHIQSTRITKENINQPEL